MKHDGLRIFAVLSCFIISALFSNLNCANCGVYGLAIREIIIEELKVSRLDSAKRHLEIAIKLYFHFDDPVSIHTLAASAYSGYKQMVGWWTGK